MLRKLSIRNAKRQAKDYLLFFITMLGAAALIYSFNSLVFSDAIVGLMGAVSSEAETYLAIIIVAFSILIALILGWFVNYMMNFMLRKRSRELSTYMILGIEKKQIANMFISENGIIGFAAYGIGLLVGFLLAELLNAMLTKSIGGAYSLSSGFSIQTIGLTFLYFLIIYFFALIGSKRKVSKMQLIDLLHFENKNETHYIKKTWIGMIVFCLSLLCGATGMYVLLNKPFGNPLDGYTLDIYFGVLLILFCLFSLFAGLSPVLQNILKKNKQWKYRKSHLLLYRLITSKINNMSTFLSGVATVFTLSITVVALAVSFSIASQKAVQMEAFDLSILHVGDKSGLEQYRQHMIESDDIEACHIYNLYTDYGNALMNVRNETLRPYLEETDSYLLPEDYIYKENQYDTFMKYSDYSVLRDMLRLEQVEIENGEFIIHCMPYLKENFELCAVTEVSDYTLSCVGVCCEDFSQYQGYGNGQEYILVVPDDTVQQMDVVYSLLAAKAKSSLSSNFFVSLKNNFGTLEFLNGSISSSIFSDDSGFMSMLIYDDMDYVSGKSVGTSIGQTMSIILPLFYLALVLCMIGTVILAVQFLSENKKYISHYNMLNVMGLDSASISKIAKKQMLLYYSLPAIPAIILGSGLAFVVSYTVFTSSFHVPVFSSVSIVTLSVVAATISLFLVIYCIYGFVSYITFKRDILKSID